MSLDAAREKIRKAAEGGERELDLGRMNLGELPAELFRLTGLTRLNVEENQLTAIPPEIGALADLEALDANDNRLSTLPPEIGQLARLKALRLQRNVLVELPPEIGKLTNLESLGLMENRLTGLPEEFGRLVNLRRSLLLKDNELTTLPASIGDLVGLESLDAGNNRLAELPSSIGNLTNLKSLLLEDNRLTRLPSDIGRLRQLTELNLRNNRLAAVPSELGELVSLKSLHLQHNRLTRLPSEIGQLINLESLSLENNQLTTLPPEVGGLDNLHSLFLKNNPLTKLPEEIARMGKLRTLSLRDNQLFPLPLTTRIREFDVFVSHAGEDKEAVALPLARALTAAGLKVWIDRQEITLGDSIRAKIDEGLSKSRYGVVILSQSFLDKGWTQRELNGLLAIEEDGEKVVLPVWHNISKSALTRFSPILSDRAAADTRDGIPAVASQIIDVVLYHAGDSPSTLFPNLTRRFVQLLRDAHSVADIRDFLIQHPKIIARALGKASWTLSATPRMFGGRIPGLTSLLINHATFQETWTARLAFASTAARLSDEGATSSGSAGEGRAALEAARTLLASEQGEWDEGVIVAGRRNELSESDKGLLNAFNQAGGRVKVRTYDWLIDACVSAENESMSFRGSRIYQQI